MVKKSALSQIKLPKDMDKRGVEEYRRIRRELEAVGVLAVDRGALIAYLEHWSRVEEAREQIAAGGMMTKTPKGQLQVSPWNGVMRQHSEALVRWVRELGLSPASRKRLNVLKPGAGEDDDDELTS